MLEIGTEVNQYRIQKHLGTGTFVEVYLATHTFLNVDRAIKILRKDHPQITEALFNDYYQRYKLEWQVAAQIHHPNLVEVYDLFEWNDALIAVVEYAPNGTLSEQLELAGRPSEDYVMDVLRDCATGLYQLHQLEKPPLVHCHINPKTIVFDKNGTAKIINLGRSRSRIAVTLRKNIKQIPNNYDMQYHAPEFEDGRFAPTLDVYSLGCVIFEMLTGKKMTRRFKSPRQIEPSISTWIDDIVTRMLSESTGSKRDADDKTKRYVDMEHLLKALDMPQELVPKALLEKMVLAFNFEELKTLAYGVGIDFGEIAGEDKTSFTRELILYSQRRDGTGALIQQLRKKRPKVRW